jgi:hypothetical protein
MVSNMTIEQVIHAHARYLGNEDARAKAEEEILTFLDVASVDEVELTGDVRIILVSADFSTEITTFILRLNKRGLDVTCIRLKPYRVGEQLIVDVSQIVPLPEAAHYEVKARAKADESRKIRTARQEVLRRFWGQLIERAQSKTTLFANRSTTSDPWLSCGLGRTGISLNVTLTADQGRVDCYINIGSDAGRSEAAFTALAPQREGIEAAFGALLEWQPMPGRLGCRILSNMEGGWQMPEQEWPALQDRLIEAVIRMEKALREPVRSLRV